MATGRAATGMGDAAATPRVADPSRAPRAADPSRAPRAADPSRAPRAADPARRLVVVGEIGRPHGVRGLVRLHVFTEDPDSFAGYNPFLDATGTRRFTVTPLPGGLGRIEGVADRDAAQRLTGTRLHVERARLAAPEDSEEFFLCDLEGLRAVTQAGDELGVIRSVDDHGAGPFLTVIGPRGELLLPFTKAVVPVVDIAAGRLVVVPPGEVVVPPQPGEEHAA